MASQGIPNDVQQFIRDCIDSIEQLEILLFLRTAAEQDPARIWTAAEVSSNLHLNLESAARRLVALQQRGLLTVARETVDAYRYAPATSRLADTVNHLSAEYKIRRVAVITMVTESGMSNIRSFSDAFRLR